MKRFTLILTLALGLVFSFTPMAWAKEPAAALMLTGPLEDMGFHASAKRGLDELGAEGWKTSLFQVGRDRSQWAESLETLAEVGEWDIIIVHGADIKDALMTAAKKFPNQKFLLYDPDFTEMPPNVHGIVYKQNESAYVAGALAGLATVSGMKGINPDKAIGFVGGYKAPVIDDFLVGYVEGAKSVDPAVRVLVNYVDSWDDPATGKVLALEQISDGVDIIFAAAGSSGLGCLEAARENGIYAIGVDSDQAALLKDDADAILTSVLKNVDKSIVRAGRLFREGKLPFGVVESQGIADGGTDIVRDAHYEKIVPAEIRDRVNEIRDDVAAGRIKVSSALNGQAMKQGGSEEAVKP